MSNFDDLCAELNKDPEFVAEYERQAPEYEALLASIRSRQMRRRIREAIASRGFVYAHQLLCKNVRQSQDENLQN